LDEEMHALRTEQAARHVQSAQEVEGRPALALQRRAVASTRTPAKANRKFPNRVKAPNRDEIWPRPLTEQLLDLKARNWRYPVSAGQLVWRI